MRRAYVDGRWGQVHRREAGSGPALLLLHQSPLSGAMFDAALPRLAERGLRAVALDTPGFGMSDPPAEPQSIVAHAEALLSVTGALGIERAHVLGHHTGAAIAVAFAVRFGERVDRLVLNGVPMFNAQEREHFGQFRFGPIEPRADGRHLTDAWEQRLSATPGWTDLKAMHRYTVEMLANGKRYWWGFAAVFEYDIEQDIRTITQPTLVLTNTGDDLYAASKRVAALRPDFGYCELEGGTHDIVDEQPQAWADAVARFLLA